MFSFRKSASLMLTIFCLVSLTACFSGLDSSKNTSDNDNDESPAISNPPTDPMY